MVFGFRFRFGLGLEFIDSYVSKIILDGIKKSVLADTNVNAKKKMVISSNESMENKNKNIVFVTCLFGSSIEKLDLPGKFIRDARYDYLLLTNFSELEFNTSWDVISIDFEKDNFRLGIGERGGYVMRSRYPKFMLWKIFRDYPEKFKNYKWTDYEMVVYCDAFLSPRENVNWLGLLDEIRSEDMCMCQSSMNVIKGRGGSRGGSRGGARERLRFMQDLHEQEDVRINGIPKEMELIVSAKKDIPQNIITSLQLMVKMLESQKKGQAGKIKQGRYCLNTVFAYDLKCAETLVFLADFWNLYNGLGVRIKNEIDKANINRRIMMTYRDQPWWNFWLIYQNKYTLIYKDNIEYKDKGNGDGNDKHFLIHNFENSGSFRGHNISYYR